jgi:hypothetical protein
MAFGPDGLTLGAGTVLAPAEDLSRADAPDALAETRLHALLSAAYLRPIAPQAIRHIRRGAASWRDGDHAMAAMHLAMTGLLPLRDVKGAARRLFMADALMKAGAEPNVILRALDLPEGGGADALTRYTPDQPRNPAGSGRASGRWTSDGPPAAVQARAAAMPVKPAAAATAQTKPLAAPPTRRTPSPKPTGASPVIARPPKTPGDAASTSSAPPHLQPVALKPVDVCAARATPPLNGLGAKSAVPLNQLNILAAEKFIQHSFPLNPVNGRPQSVFGGAIKSPGQVIFFAAQLVFSHDSVPTSLGRVRITGDMGQIMGKDRDGYPTNYLTLILSPPVGQNKEGLPIREAVSIYPGC